MNQNITLHGKKIFNDNNIFCICITFYYALSILNRVQISLLQGSNVLSLFIRFGTYGLILFILLGVIVNLRKFMTFIILEILVAAIFIISIFMGNIENANWRDVYTLVATTYIPLAVAAYNVVDRKKLLKSLYLVSLVSVPILIAVAVWSYGKWEYSYDMSLGYAMAFSALVLLAQFTIDSKIHNIVLAVILSAFILFVGSRGPFICIISFILIELFLSKRYDKKKKAIISILMSALMGILLLNFDKILMYVYQLSVDLGFDSRSILLLLQGEAISHDSGRNVLQEYYMGLIHRDFVLGYGVMGKWLSDGMYPHNIVLEFLLAFGYPLGVSFLIVLLLIVVRAVRKETDKYNNALIILFVSFCMQLFVSNSFLKVWQFWVCFALCFPNKRILREQQLMKILDKNVKCEEMKVRKKRTIKIKRSISFKI